MNKEIVSDKQGISLIFLFIIGSSFIYLVGIDAKRDAWLAIIWAIFMALPMALIYIRLHNIFPDKDLFDIIEICFGKFIGKGLIILFTFFFLYWTADVLNNYGYFISQVSLPETPRIIPMILLIALNAWGIKQGIETLGRWADFFLKVPIILIFITITLLFNKMNINNIFPIFYDGIKPILSGALDTFSFPFAQIMAFSIIFSSFERKKSPNKIYITGLFLGGLMLLITSLLNTLVLGSIATTLYYSSYSSVAAMNLGIFQRSEVVIAITFALGGFIKISVLLLCTCKGICKIFGCNDYRFIIIPITLLVINLSFFQYKDVTHYNEFQTKIWLHFTSPFQFILPIIILIFAEIKKKRLFTDKNISG